MLYFYRNRLTNLNYPNQVSHLLVNSGSLTAKQYNKASRNHSKYI